MHAATKTNLAEMKGVDARDRKMIEDADVMLGPEPEEMGFIKNLFWGRVREDLVFPYPQQSVEETAKCEKLLAKLDAYLATEHPSTLIDQEEYIPDTVIQRLFDMGVLGMTIPESFGGLGLGITSYNRVLERLGAACASTSVVVSAHQSIGCKALMLFGTDSQKQKYLPLVAREKLSAFCLSEPNVGCDAGGQETRCVLSEDGSHFTLNGEKKWSTSGAIAGLLTVMAKQTITDPRTGKSSDRVTALMVTPDTPGVEVFEKNRSKCGIRGTWQARIRFTDVKIPRENLLHKEGSGLKVALTCLNYGRCTLSAGTLGGARRAAEQATKWAMTRHQFQRPLSDFESVQQRVARMHAYVYAVDAMLYMTTGFLDRSDADIMVETAACKVFASELGWRVVNDAMTIMGGEGYMTENELERAFRDARIYTMVEGANEVMQPFIFAYGGKQLAEQMVGIKDALEWDRDDSALGNLRRIFHNATRSGVLKTALPLGMEVVLGKKPAAPVITSLHGSLGDHAARFSTLVREHTFLFKRSSKEHEAKIVTRQCVQARLADSAMWLHGIACVLSKLDSSVRAGATGSAADRDRTAAAHFLDLAALEIGRVHRELREHADDSMFKAASAAMSHTATLPNADFIIPERSPTDAGTGRTPAHAGIRQFPCDGALPAPETASM